MKIYSTKTSNFTMRQNRDVVTYSRTRFYFCGIIFWMKTVEVERRHYMDNTKLKTIKQ